jgi:hypothetical protein
MYLILPPPQTRPETYNDQNPKDTTGNGIQGWHNKGRTVEDPLAGLFPALLTLYWAIVKTNDVGDPSLTDNFVNGVAPTIGHELVEQFVDRNGKFEELGDPCNDNRIEYRGWSVEQYHSDWDTSFANLKGCINGDSPVSLKRFLRAIGFDYQHQGLKKLGAATITVDYIAATMRSR